MDPTSATRPTIDGKEYHIDLARGDMPPMVLIPGDPDRVELMASLLDDHETMASHREYRSARGTFSGTPVGICSTGIGGPSAAIAVEELANIGVHTFIRVGSTGVLADDVACGDVVISTAAVRLEGTSKQYVMRDYPACPHYEVTLSLIEACERLDIPYHLGITASTDSFYVGQGRPGHDGYMPLRGRNLLEELESANVLNLEMEAATVFTLGSLYGLRTGCVCTVFANRKTNEFLKTGEDNAALVACTALSVLSEWDELKKTHEKRYFSPGLLRG
ncbi:nucleoside phosphorylase [archaeon]|nr:MAG: nucleoside phosphorylase [archaeon]